MITVSQSGSQIVNHKYTSTKSQSNNYLCIRFLEFVYIRAVTLKICPIPYIFRLFSCFSFCFCIFFFSFLFGLVWLAGWQKQSYLFSLYLFNFFLSCDFIALRFNFNFFLLLNVQLFACSHTVAISFRFVKILLIRFLLQSYALFTFQRLFICNARLWLIHCQILCVCFVCIQFYYYYIYIF